MGSLPMKIIMISGIKRRDMLSYNGNGCLTKGRTESIYATKLHLLLRVGRLSLTDVYLYLWLALVYCLMLKTLLFADCRWKTGFAVNLQTKRWVTILARFKVIDCYNWQSVVGDCVNTILNVCSPV